MKRSYTEEQRAANRARVAAWQKANAERAKARGTRWRAANRDHVNELARKRAKTPEARAKQRARRTPDVTHADWLMRKYGITVEEWAALFKAQGQRCACCGSVEPSSRLGWHTDHDHHKKRERGQPHIVRGIVCHHCNIMLGAARDSVERLACGQRYLESAA